MERFRVSGKGLPYKLENEVVPLAEISISESLCDVALFTNGSISGHCQCEIWEHTIYELETLSMALHACANGPFPSRLECTAPNSRIGTSLNLSLAADL